MSLGYARARRDLGCRYTLGFYETDPKFDLRKRVRIETRRPGLRVLHPEAYTFPSKTTVLESTIRAAYLLPSRYATGAVRVHAFPVRPEGSKTWEALLVVEFPVRIAPDGTPAVHEFGAVVKSGSKVLHRFSRALSVTPVGSAGGSERTASFVERVVLPEGEHTVVSVLSGKASERPEAVDATIVIPTVPRGREVLPTPVLGRESGRDVVVYAGDDAESDRIAAPAAFRPIIVQQLAGSEVSFALTQGCIPKRKGDDASLRLVRSLLGADGSAAGSLPDVPFTEAENVGRSFRCVGAVDEIPLGSLRPGGYRFRASLLDAAGTEKAQTETAFERLPRGTVAPAP